MEARRDVQEHYRNRKGFISVNVLGVCDKDMKFIYMLTGWEGSAADGRVLRNAMHRDGGFTVPRGSKFTAFHVTITVVRI